MEEKIIDLIRNVWATACVKAQTDLAKMLLAADKPIEAEMVILAKLPDCPDTEIMARVH